MEEGALSSSSLVSNGSVNFRGRIADKRTTGGWKASSFVIANELAERLAFFSIAGMVMLTISSTMDSLRPPPCRVRPCVQPNAGQNAFLTGALALIALGTGGIKPCVSSFGADQYDEADEKEVKDKSGFFNWFFLAINMGAVLAVTVMAFIQDRLGYAWGFGIPTGMMIFSIVILATGMPFYRFKKPMGSPFTRFLQVVVASLRNHFIGVGN
ncbi:hypothetical protein Pint_09043 [Pistacia integerrima]|uniref:Uncharacterized protein n=1 Tax=Pistacia integerrima TaxID=434235 RepID=A0ACC0XTJ8_9ROSI|nr:hypothetical protein Pint_09043 [Pistacia integerrima]